MRRKKVITFKDKVKFKAKKTLMKTNFKQVVGKRSNQIQFQTDGRQAREATEWVKRKERRTYDSPWQSSSCHAPSVG